MQIESYTLTINQLEPALESDKTAMEQAVSQVDFYIDAYVILLQAQSPKPPKQAIDEAKAQLDRVTTIATERTATYQANKIILERFKLERTNLEKRLEKVLALPKSKTVDAWCATFTEEATGNVQTLEVPGYEPDTVLIYPKAIPIQAFAGIALSREAMSPEQVYFNAAVLPGYQKWYPTYRFGRISAINYGANTATVAVLPALSSADDLPLNVENELLNVPIEYLNCNAAAFDVDDDVVIQFQGYSWDDPKVIGFKSNPKPCGWSAYYGSWTGPVFYIDGAVGVEKYFDPDISEFQAYHRTEGGSWTSLSVVNNSSSNRKWADTSVDPANLRPEIEILRDVGYNAYMICDNLIYRSGSPIITYTMTGVNEFRLMKGTKKMFHYAYLVTNGYTSGQTADVVCRPFLVAGTVIKPPDVDEQPYLPHVDDYIEGWEATA
jgi:hypothetical protein